MYTYYYMMYFLKSFCLILKFIEVLLKNILNLSNSYQYKKNINYKKIMSCHLGYITIAFLVAPSYTRC